MDGREQVLAILEVLGRVADGLESAGLSNVSEELKGCLPKLDEVKNKLFMRSKKSLNFTNPLLEAAVTLEGSLDSTGKTAEREGEILKLWEDVIGKLEALEKAVKSHSVLIT